MQIQVSPESESSDPSSLLLTVSGEIDADNCIEFRTQLLDSAEKHTSLVLDLSAVSFIDSSGVSELLRTGQALAERGATLSVSAASSPVVRVLEITGLLEHFGLS